MIDTIPSKELKKIETILQTLADADLFFTGDLNDYTTHFSENMYCIGTAADERYTSKDQFSDSIQQMIGTLHDSQRRIKIESYTLENLKMANNVVWFALKINAYFEDQEFKNLDNFASPSRYTGILVKENSDWKIQQFHVSSPDVMIAKGELMPTTEGIKQTINRWIEKFRINPIITDETKQRQLQNYLIKAQELIDSSV
ncbi:MAG: nuclear transport factor 2 family protein [Candidatus Kariarchaeaceae archaeon]|jgi:hypothetical protein